MLRKLGSRLTALATLITLVVCALACVALYLGIHYSLYREVDGFLAGEVAEFRAILSAADGDLAEVQQRIRAELGSRLRGDLAFRLLDDAGRVIVTSETGDEKLPDPWPAPPRPSGDYLLRTEVGRAFIGHTRTCSEWVDAADGTTRIVQATYLLDQVNASLARFLQICLATLGLAALLAVIGGRWLAARSLYPVAQMTSAARAISVENLTKRLQRSGSGDELDLLAETFNHMFDRLERQVTRLRQFTADAAHELRTPLSALRGNAEVALSRDREPAELRASIADSIEEYDRLTRIAEDLLLLARADAGQDFVRRAPLRLDDALADMIDLYGPMAEESGVALRCDRADVVQIDGDDGRLRQMIGNLLDNAIKYTPPGGQVTVTLVACGDGCELRVRDTGVGISPEHLPHVFDRFYRADRARSRNGAGAGLGLSICRTIVAAHGGKLSAMSEPGRGAEFVVTLVAMTKQPSRARS